MPTYAPSASREGNPLLPPGTSLRGGRADGEVAHPAAHQSAAAAPPRMRGVGRQNLLATLIDAANDLDVGCTVVHVLPRLPGGSGRKLRAPMSLSGRLDGCVQSAEGSVNAGATTKIGLQRLARSDVTFCMAE